MLRFWVFARAFAVGICLVCVSASAQGPWLLPDLQELGSNDSLRRHRDELSAQQLAAIRRATAATIRSCAQEDSETDERQPSLSNLLLSLRAKKVPLGVNGTGGIVVQGMGSCMCGATGNCPIWIFSDAGGVVRMVFRKQLGVQSFAILNSSSSGYFDIVLGQHGSAYQTYLQELHFDGQNYRRSRCAEMNSMDEHFHLKKVPSIKPSECW